MPDATKRKMVTLSVWITTAVPEGTDPRNLTISVPPSLLQIVDKTTGWDVGVAHQYGTVDVFDDEDGDDTTACDECHQPIPDDEPDVINAHHHPTCSCYPHKD